MSVHKKKTLRRWSLRILLMILLLPVVLLIVIRSAGWFHMRKSDREIKAYIGPHCEVSAFDTFYYHQTPVVFLTTQGDTTKKNEAIIFVHGSPGSIDAYMDYLIDTNLLSKADLIAYDRPGLGNSDFGTSLPSLYLQAEVLHTLMDSLPYDQYWLVGHSYGAPIIVQTAIRFPRKIEGICLVAGSVSASLEPKAAWRKWIDLPLLRDLLPPAMRVSNEELMPLKQDLEMIEDDWGKIKIPVSLIHGTKDALVPFENLAFAQQQLTNADTVTTLIFENQSHFILWTHKQEIVSDIISLMNIAQ